MFCEKCQPKFEDFWAYLIEQTESIDAWWLDAWLEDRKEEYSSLPRCACGSRERREKEIQSRTGTFCLEVQTLCRKCNALLSTTDMRDLIRKRLRDGTVYTKDKAILEMEVGKESGKCKAHSMNQ